MFKKSKIFSILFGLCLIASSEITAKAFEPNPDSIPFAPPVHYPVGDEPVCVHGADFDRDGDIDLAVANKGPGTVSILKNYGDGMFEPAIDYWVGIWPFSVFPADFDTDGYCDLVVANSGENTISILMNRGDGTFILDSAYQVSPDPICVSSADLDGDGDFDVAVTCNDGFRICTLENNGEGTFQLMQEIVQDCPWPISLADLDNDGDCDMASSQAYCSDGDDLFIYMNYGNGIFAPPDGYQYYSPTFSSIFAADFDIDGDYDLALTDYYGGEIFILKNNGDGTFQDPAIYPGSGGLTFCVFGSDLDSDGDCDLTTASYSQDYIDVFQNRGDGTFYDRVRIPYWVGSYPFSVFSADLDGDLDNDLVTANYVSDNLSVLLNQTVTDISDNIWVHLAGSPEIARGETLQYTLSCGNISSLEATECSLFFDFGQLEVVYASLPFILIGDSVLWEIGTLQAGESRQILIDLTLPLSSSSQYLSEKVHPILWFLVTVVAGKLVWEIGSYLWEEVVDPHPDIYLRKQVTNAFRPPSRVVWFSWGNQGHNALCENSRISATIVCSAPECLLDVSAESDTITHIGDEWEIIWKPGDLGPSGLDAVWLSISSDFNCANDTITIYAEAHYYNEDEEPDHDMWDNRVKRQKHLIVFAIDPNEMAVYPEDFIRPSHTLNYTVFFENEGTAPAESVRVISEVDTALADQTLFITDTSAVYNAFHRRIDWNFPHINLPPDSSNFVSYRIQAKDSLASGTIIRGDAMIYFDYMPGVPCSVFVTVDALNPISQVDSVIRVAFPDTYEVFWSGYDPTPGASGILSYSIYFSTDGGPDSLWLADTAWSEEDTLQTSATFIAESGHYYCFTSIAMDQVWNIEEPPGAPDACLPFLRGDANADWKIDIADAVYIINYLFINGPAPNPLERADCNCDGAVNIADAVYLINYLFTNGPPPQC